MYICETGSTKNCMSRSSQGCEPIKDQTLVPVNFNR